MRAALTVLFVLLLASPATAQFSINPNSQLQWDQSAATLAAAQGYTYDLAIDAGTSSETIIRLADVTCVKGTSPTSHVCSAPIPAVAVGTHSLRLIAVEERSGPSEHVTVTASQADPRCVFPTGSASVTIFRPAC